MLAAPGCLLAVFTRGEATGFCQGGRLHGGERELVEKAILQLRKAGRQLGLTDSRGILKSLLASLEAKSTGNLSSSCTILLLFLYPHFKGWSRAH